MEEIEKVRNQSPSQEIDYFKLGRILISRWYWIVGSLIIFMLASSLYLWYTPKTYATGGTMKLEDKKTEMSDLMSAISSTSREPSKVQSETAVLQSHAVLLNAIKDLDYPVSFFIEGRVRTSEVYPLKPLDVQILQFDTLNYYHDLISFKAVNTDTFNLSYMLNGKKVAKNYTYNSAITIANTSFIIKKTSQINSVTVYLFKFNIPEEFIGRVRGGMNTSELVKNSNILYLQETDANPQFAADVLNAIMKEYLIYDRNRKTQSASQMINFIDDQLKYLSAEVKGSEKSIQNFKQKNKIMDVSASADAALSSAKEIQTQQSVLKLQLLSLDQLKQQIAKEKNNVNLNFDAGGGQVDAGLSGMVSRLDNLLQQRTDLLKTFNSTSQPIQDLNRSILQIKNNALNTISTSYDNVKRNIGYLDTQLAAVNQRIAAMPVAEREVISLKRDFEINEKVYSFLSEKKLEAQISRSGILPGATIIEQAQPNFSPVSPDEHDINRTAFIFGLVAGVGLIVLIRILNPYIYDKETVESLTSIPIIGVIRRFPEHVDENNTQVLAISRPKSIFAESVRSVRTNLNFLASDKQTKMVCITSEVAGEGKSFVAVNLSSTLALIDKKVILIGADLRRSKLHKTFKVPNDVGLSTYLSHQSSIEDIIQHSPQENLDFIISGPVPPNPSELLHSERMSLLIKELGTKYDVIMIDTAPIGLVSDAIPVIRMSDINIFVIRSGKSKIHAASIPQRIANEYSLDNTVIVLNAYAEDVLHSRFYSTKFSGDTVGKHYYYSDYSEYKGSGYYVDDEEKKWWNIKRWIKS